MEWHKDGYLITDDKSKIQLDVVQSLLAETYWRECRPPDTVKCMIEGSICFILIRKSLQIGFGRAVTDRVTFTWVADL